MRRGHRPSQVARVTLVCGVFATLLSGTVAAVDGAGPDDADEAQLRYLIERAACDDGHPDRDREACLREAAAARSESREGRLQDGRDTEAYRRNALRRCDALSGRDRDDCIARMLGQGTTDGSVEAGGIYREFRTREIAPGGGGQTGR